jgi:hypothetical protein
MKNGEIEKEIEIILKNRNSLERKYYEYLCDKAMKERYFKLGDIEFSFRRAIVYYKEDAYPYERTHEEVLSFEIIDELESKFKDYEINDMLFDIKYNGDCKVLKLSRLSKDGKIYMYIEKE